MKGKLNRNTSFHKVLSGSQKTNFPLKRVFYAMPFTGKSYEEILEIRSQLKNKIEDVGLELVEQFIGVEEKDKYETHAYSPLFIVKKDRDLLKSADIIISDYSSDSIGRDCEIVIGKEILDKRVIAIVPDPHMQNHPWIRLCSDYIVSSQDEAIGLAKKLSQFNLSTEISKLSREQKDTIDKQIDKILSSAGVEDIVKLFPTELKRRWKQLFGDEYNDVVRASFAFLPAFFRVNTLSSTPEELKAIAKKYSWKITPLKFSDRAFKLDLSPVPNFEELPEYQEGKFYIQQLASQLPAIALDPQPGEKILDIAAAPGSKTTQMAEMIRDQGEILANDNSEERMEILKNAAERQKIKCIKFHLGDGSMLGNAYPEYFDKVMVDAPCSSEGILRYKAHKFFEWHLLGVYRATEVQKRLIDSGYKALRSGGVLVYSTCAFGPEENEAIADYLIKKYPSAKIESVEFAGVKTKKGMTQWSHLKFDESVAKSVRLQPNKNDSVGFFLVKIKKNCSR